jgi:hypothetical protein
MNKHYMTKSSNGMVSGCGKRSFQFGLSTMFTNIPAHVQPGCKKCEDAAKKEL